jgi:hypothetical protein
MPEQHSASTAPQRQSRVCNAPVTRQRELYDTVTGSVTDVYALYTYYSLAEHAGRGKEVRNNDGSYRNS